MSKGLPPVSPALRHADSEFEAEALASLDSLYRAARRDQKVICRGAAGEVCSALSSGSFNRSKSCEASHYSVHCRVNGVSTDSLASAGAHCS